MNNLFDRTKGNFAFWRIGSVVLLLLGVTAFYIYKLLDLQVLNAQDYVTAAKDNRTREISIQTQRGTITDRNGYVLARNVPSYNVVITPANLPADDGVIQQLFRELSELVDVPVSNGDPEDLFTPCNTDLGITEIVYIGDTTAPYEPVRIACDIDETLARVIEEKSIDWPGVSILVEPVRDYPSGWFTSEIVGFLGPIPASMEEYYTDQGFVPNRDKVGYAGIESSMNDELLGKNGSRTVEVDVAGQIMRDTQPPTPPESGMNVTLTIDTRLQMAAKQALVGDIEYWSELSRLYGVAKVINRGVVIAIDPRTGEIKALVTEPTFENNRMARFIPGYYYEQLMSDPRRPLFNQAISAEVPPGSVYKMAASTGFMNEQVVSKDFLVEDLGKIIMMEKYHPNDPGTPKEYVCYDENGHGMVDFLHAVALSCDVYFYKVSGGFGEEVKQGLGVWKMADYAKALGYGVETGIELPGEMTGLVPDPNWKRLTLYEAWSTGDTYIASMGQGYVLSTPMQVLVSFAILANDGKYMQPTLIYKVRDAEGNLVRPFEPKVKWDITTDPLIPIYDEDNFTTGDHKVITQETIELQQQGMRMVVLPGGTAYDQFVGAEFESAGKTGTAEYCDDEARAQDLCERGRWPAHAWYAGYAPYDNPELVVVAFVYNGGEGASVAAPIVRKVLDAYFKLKAEEPPAPTLPEIPVEPAP